MPTTEAKTTDAKIEAQAPKRLPIWVEPQGLAVIKRAVQLRLALMGEAASDDPELHGAALVSIVTAWMQGEAEQIRAARA